MPSNKEIREYEVIRDWFWQAIAKTAMRESPLLWWADSWKPYDYLQMLWNEITEDYFVAWQGATLKRRN